MYKPIKYQTNIHYKTIISKHIHVLVSAALYDHNLLNFAVNFSVRFAMREKKQKIFFAKILRSVHI